MKCLYCGENRDAYGGCCYENWADRAEENWRVPLVIFLLGSVFFGIVVLFVI
jgi:hypothetical protein